MSTSENTLAPTVLPALGAALAGGIFAGLTTDKAGQHFAVVLLPGRADSKDWPAAQAWAKEQGGELPSRAVALLLFTHVKDQLPRTWHWTSEPDGASYAWCCYFAYGHQSTSHQSAELAAVAVRQIPISASIL
ncbi:hypothetical protein [Pseudacidovorax sp. RU35E]|uniref:hypothetical protein n=1 Tax=Pseudacidovorax sp. RU35E TaxID=1907403 RepID=UPI0009552252|nr:hypothetical protein [Pseudacidovorax sp. RU35E]SIR00653.1 hypothetical protein SAMN05880557_107102 [Pseudacidovorax sp. RU35E]